LIHVGAYDTKSVILHYYRCRDEDLFENYLKNKFIFRNQQFEDIQVYLTDSRNPNPGNLQNYTAINVVIHPSFQFNVVDRIIEYNVALIQVL